MTASRTKLSARALCLALVLSQLPLAALADSLGVGTGASGSVSGLSLSQDLGAASSGSEFVSGNFPGAILMPVNLWGAIPKAGIHHIPTHTDLITLLSLAGGPLPDAELDKIIIKRRSSGEEQVLKVDAEEILTEPNKHSPILEANDIIIIPREKPTVSPNTLTAVSFVAAILGIVTAGYAIAQASKNH